ncbi:MAG TPA: PspC domain-containing protein [Bacteroidaceae bacterium]|nr:PspC domain-containing protein [Bacteroidaceae bacterium]
MKKAIKINLSGIIFHIDEDAYEKLKHYLDSISSYFSNKSESKEIIDDIETRIAELFQERITGENQVITLEIVNEVIEIMGNPEDIADTGETAGESGSGYHETYRRSRRLYRDPENSVIGGVCGGLGAYFNIDPLIFRLLFVVLFFVGGASILVYIILWIAIPRAETAAQKLEMRGEKVTVSNIEKKIREEYENVKENVKENVHKAKESETYKKTRRATNDFFEVLGKIILIAVKVILIIIGTGLILAGIGLLIGLIAGTFAGIHIFPFGPYDFSLSDILSPFTDPVSVSLLVISICLVFLIPIIALIYGLIKLIFQVKSSNRGLAIGAITLWVISLVMVIGICAFELNNYSSFNDISTSHDLNIDSDTIYIAINDSQRDYLDRQSLFDIDEKWYILENADEIYGRVDLDIEKISYGNFSLDIIRKSKGKNLEQAERNARTINYNFRTRNNHLVLDPYFFIEAKDKWRFPRVELVMNVPEGKVVVLDRNTRYILDNVQNVDRLSDWNMAGKTWLMTEDGLQKISEK